MEMFINICTVCHHLKTRPSLYKAYSFVRELFPRCTLIVFLPCHHTQHAQDVSLNKITIAYSNFELESDTL